MRVRTRRFGGLSGRERFEEGWESEIGEGGVVERDVDLQGSAETPGRQA